MLQMLTICLSLGILGPGNTRKRRPFQGPATHHVYRNMCHLQRDSMGLPVPAMGLPVPRRRAPRAWQGVCHRPRKL